MLIERVILENYKSIAHCDVELPQVCFMIGPNGSGKSNFIDIFQFLLEAVEKTIEDPIQNRDGFQKIIHNGNTQSNIKTEIKFHQKKFQGTYKLSLANQEKSIIQYEYLEDIMTNNKKKKIIYERDTYNFKITLVQLDDAYGDFHQARPLHPQQKNKILNTDKIYIYSEPTIQHYHPFYFIKFYHLQIHSFTSIQKKSIKEMLPDGQFAYESLFRLQKERPYSFKIINQYLSLAMPFIKGVRIESMDEDNLKILFHVLQEDQKIQILNASQMSDGTLLLLGHLIALFQHFEDEEEHLIILEEPENSLHPAAAGILRDALTEAGQRNQILVTTHNDNLLDSKDIDPAWVLVAQTIGGQTYIGPIDPVDQEFIRAGRFTVGGLMETNQLYSQEARAKLWALSEAGE